MDMATVLGGIIAAALVVAALGFWWLLIGGPLLTGLTSTEQQPES